MIPTYLRLAFWPQPLVLNYGWPLPLALQDVLPSALFVIALLVLTIVLLIRWPGAGFAAAWFFIVLAPTSSIVPIATEVGAERRMYLPLVALVATVVVAAYRALRHVPFATQRFGGVGLRVGPVGALAVGTVSAALMTATFLRNQEYSSAVSLARTTVERHPSPVAHDMLGRELSIAGDHGAALVELRKALPGAPHAHYALGIELFNQGQLDEAVAELHAFVRADPMRLEAIPARQIAGRARAKQQRWAEAAEEFQAVLTMRPGDVTTEGLLGDALFQDHRYQEAIAHLRAYLARSPTDLGCADTPRRFIRFDGQPGRSDRHIPSSGGDESSER